MDMLNETTAVEDTLSTLAAHESSDAPFTVIVGDETTHHIDFDAACKHVVDRIGPAHIVLRRDHGARRLGAWVGEYNVETEPSATITWRRGAKL